jgi:hypothetical protein
MPYLIVCINCIPHRVRDSPNHAPFMLPNTEEFAPFVSFLITGLGEIAFKLISI